MIRYDFDQLSEDAFEALVIDLCNDLLGIGVHSFTKGPDGGKDGFFTGTAQAYPSKAEPWKGDFIIQAKHTTDLGASCADNDFFSNQTSVINKEIKRLIERRTNNGQNFDCYLIFTNRKMPGAAHTDIKNYLHNELGVQNVDVHGVEYLTRLIELKPEMVKKYGLLRNLLPDQFYENDIRDVIVLFSQNTDWMQAAPIGDENPMDYTDKERKNALNQVSDYYFSEINSHSLKYFNIIDSFLKDPRNSAYLLKYENTTSDIRGYIQKNIANHSFMDLLEAIAENIAGADPTTDIHRVRKLCRVFVHYMYYNCDIGQKE